MLELDGVEVRYGSVPAVRGLSFRVDRGEIVGLIGPNGAGKSTTLSAVMGLVPVHRGQIRLRGAPLRGSPERIASCMRRLDMRLNHHCRPHPLRTRLGLCALVALRPRGAGHAGNSGVAPVTAVTRSPMPTTRGGEE